MWQLWLSGLIGIWFIISPWVYGFGSSTGATLNSIILGAIVLILAVWLLVQKKNKS
ncbi:SPW repeat protein [Alicyclobacillus fodiniaquatilis]|uniref:SPW repeat protein n=1 Tax=Alicyclobacillus fodiniaquatilis TaxID=1661150 RepID=A0ABW4JKK4_9BACL